MSDLENPVKSPETEEIEKIRERLKGLREKLNQIPNPESNRKIYNEGLQRLYETFSNIPEDLTNKRVNIRYMQDDELYVVSLSSNWISIKVQNGKVLKFSKDGTRSISLPHNRRWIQLHPTYSELKEWINKIIENADKCEVKIENISWQYQEIINQSADYHQQNNQKKGSRTNSETNTKGIWFDLKDNSSEKIIFGHF